ncbi:helix-hairpin-helix domain-containing protein [Bacillus xiapuensis]|uniref:helix-hairpin-helix domain-containing protein n=1 Tax=Bacillus xiapuensis TaxID=2014075 RepID=UPI000C23A63B|nr:helix-hairpin-helix domain-containing protein [Bacillus xiapuensis]
MDVKALIEKYKLFVILLAAAGIFGLYQLSAKEAPPAQPLTAEIHTPSSKETSPASSEEKKETKEEQVVMVDMKGAVPKPGIYTLKQGARIHDAIAKAGGLQKDADRTAVNLAQKLQDEMIVYIPKIGEKPPAQSPSVSSAIPGASSPADGSKPETKININAASAEELQTMPGIGEAKAQAIIDYRETEGAFAKPEDLKNVTGIGEKTFEKLEPLISVN